MQFWSWNFKISSGS